MKKLVILVIVLLMVLSCALVACDKTNGYVADNTEHYDDITKTLKFKSANSYEGKKFMSDGLALVTVESYTDGDTTRFYSASDGQAIPVRYYCVDTPESTGGVEKWGKAASNFVKDQLKQATAIVLESSTGGAASKDSYGTRWLGYVWYKTATEDFKLLNLELVENGYSVNKGDSTGKYVYNEYFVKAEKFARSIQLRLFSKKDDPLYNNDPLPFTIKEFEASNDLFYNFESETGSKVIFDAYLTSVRVSGTWHTFTAVQYDEETGKEYKIDVYTGSNSNTASLQFRFGELYTIIGSIQPSDNGFQVSGISLALIPPTNGNPTGKTFLKQSHYYLMFDSSVTTNVDRWDENLYSNVTVTGTPTLADGVVTFTGTATRKGATEATTFTFKLKASAVPAAIANGATLVITGLQLEAGTITVITYSK